MTVIRRDQGLDRGARFIRVDVRNGEKALLVVEAIQRRVETSQTRETIATEDILVVFRYRVGDGTRREDRLPSEQRRRGDLERRRFQDSRTKDRQEIEFWSSAI